MSLLGIADNASADSPTLIPSINEVVNGAYPDINDDWIRDNIMEYNSGIYYMFVVLSLYCSFIIYFVDSS